MLGDMDLPRLTGRLLEAAIEAGEATLTYFGTDSGARLKADDSPVTEADLASNRVLLAAIARLTPDIPCLSEESASPAYGDRRGWERFWLVDPLDGTREFLAGGDEYTVNVALVEKGAPVLGILVAPRLKLSYWAFRGGGAWRAQRSGRAERIRGRFAAPGEPRAVVRSRRSDAKGPLSTYLKLLPIEKVVEVSGALKFACLAEGRANLYARFAPSMEWDVAAGDCLLREAVAEYEDPPFRYNKPSLRNGPFLLG